MLGEQWSRESVEVKSRWKAVADDIKKKHSEMFPDYQYQPRKPSEKKRRMTRRKAAALAKVAASDGRPMSSPAQSSSTATGDSDDQAVASASLSSSVEFGTGDSLAFVNDTNDSVAVGGFNIFDFEPLPEPIPTFETAANGNLFFDLDNTASDEAFSTMLAQYNETLPPPAPERPGMIQPNDYPVISYNPTEDAVNDQSFFTSMCDWDNLGQEAEDNIEEALPEFEPEVQFDWAQDWSVMANAELERMPAA